MNIISLIFEHFFAFLLIISVIVFVHEFGHFWVARRCGVMVEKFSIGFGPKIFGFCDKKKTEWKFCILPLGGYVKMHGDSNAASLPDFEAAKKMPENLRKISFLGKNVYQRFAIVAAGPAANFIFAILLLTGIFFSEGKTKIEPVISQIVENGAAFEAKMQIGDRIIAVEQQAISDFNDIRQIVSKNGEKSLKFKILRENQELEVFLKPKIVEQDTIFGEKIKTPMIGIAADKITVEQLNFWQSFVAANQETYQLSGAIFHGIGELITGKRSVKELGGPVKIARYSKESVSKGILVLAWFMAVISINLGAMNLLPLPVLDGGHLLFFAFEAVFGKPLPVRIQKIAFQIGLALVLTLMIIATSNDLLGIFSEK